MGSDIALVAKVMAKVIKKPTSCARYVLIFFVFCVNFPHEKNSSKICFS